MSIAISNREYISIYVYFPEQEEGELFLFFLVQPFILTRIYSRIFIIEKCMNPI